MPASVLRAYKAVLGGILVSIDCFKPVTANQGRVEEKVHFLAVEVGLGVEVAIA